MASLVSDDVNLAHAAIPTLAPPSAATRSAADRDIARHHIETEQALAQIRNDPDLTDCEKGRYVTRLLAEANARTLALCSVSRREM